MPSFVITLLFLLGLQGSLTAQFDIPPIFEGCDDPLISEEQQVHCSKEKLVDYVQRKISYPDSSALKGVQGLIVLRFTVDVNGSVTMVELLRGLDRACNEEALQVVRSLPKFIPAQLNKHPTNATLVLPVRFGLNNLMESPTESLYHWHWAKTPKQHISKRQLDSMIQDFPFVRSAAGLNFRIEKLELTYIRGKKVIGAKLRDEGKWTAAMLDIFKKARKGGILVFSAEITDKFQKVEVVQEYYLDSHR